MLIRNIWAVGRNYADHAKELGNAVPAKPLMFLKAGSSASVNSTEIILPHWVTEVHHEVELALKFSNHLHIIEGAVALDLTERNLQNEAKKAGQPWTLAKSFHSACAVSAFFMVRKLDECRDLRLRLWVNDELRQDGRTSQMIFGFEEVIEFAKEHFPVCPGDLLLTGTPAGVGPIRAGDRVKVEIEGQISHTWQIKQEAPPNKAP
jgi:2-keto-4-pentenoate hydratase/2-oxohepta-3-ene-1,7-dioic acid hydratase in catechol pathway